MLTVNRNLLLFCAHRRKLLQCLVNNHFSKLDTINFVTCSVLLNGKKGKDISLLVTPLPVKMNNTELAVGSELTGALDRKKLLKVMNLFFRSPNVKSIAKENGLDEYVLANGFSSFRTFCLESKNLPADLHIILSDVITGHGNPVDIFPYFLKHVKQVYPHLECMEDLKKIGDLRYPASWYQSARAMKRKFIFHCGPTNSGKTYQAIKKFEESESGVYCGPLKLLAVEIYNKVNEKNIPCDLVTGEEIIQVGPNGEKSNHVSCTIEMVSTENEYDVAIIDEIQMIKDPQRGWAWTRALLGLKAKEIHLCGEEAALDLIDSILCSTNEEMEVNKYERLTKLSVVPAVKSFSNVQPGDCIVCFNKSDIYKVTHALELLEIESAVIYGSLPPGTKTAQCKKFNDPKHPCKVLVATDAVGMGLNLSIKRIVFYSLIKHKTNELGLLEHDYISVSQALQIAGRAGRYNSRFNEGFVTTFKEKDLAMLEVLMAKTPEPVLTAGLLPTADQIELFSYYLPNSPLCKLIEIFMKLSTLDDSIYFMCDMKNFIYLAQLIEHIQLPLSVKFTFCCAPIDKKFLFSCTMFVKFAKLFSENNAVTYNWLCDRIDWPLEEPKNIAGIVKCEEVHDVLDLYLWLSNRFPNYFPDVKMVKSIQKQTDDLILKGVLNLSKIFKISENTIIFNNEGEKRKSKEEIPKTMPAQEDLKEEMENLEENRKEKTRKNEKS